MGEEKNQYRKLHLWYTVKDKAKLGILKATKKLVFKGVFVPK